MLRMQREHSLQTFRIYTTREAAPTTDQPLRAAPARIVILNKRTENNTTKRGAEKRNTHLLLDQDGATSKEGGNLNHGSTGLFGSPQVRN